MHILDNLKKSNEMVKRKWGSYLFEFSSIFIAVVAGFALSNWDEDRRDEYIGLNILQEISNGFALDIEDVNINMRGHRVGVRACNYFRDIINNKPVDQDSLRRFYSSLLSDVISIQNTAGYESLKSKGLETIKNESLRFEIISLYEFDFNVLKKFEEEYYEMQFHEIYYKEINNLIAPNFNFDTLGNIASIAMPLKLNNKDKNLLLSYLWKIERNRNFMLRQYNGIEQKILRTKSNIEDELK